MKLPILISSLYTTVMRLPMLISSLYPNFIILYYRHEVAYANVIIIDNRHDIPYARTRHEVTYTRRYFIIVWLDNLDNGTIITSYPV